MSSGRVRGPMAAFAPARAVLALFLAALVGSSFLAQAQDPMSPGAAGGPMSPGGAGASGPGAPDDPAPSPTPTTICTEALYVDVLGFGVTTALDVRATLGFGAAGTRVGAGPDAGATLVGVSGAFATVDVDGSGIWSAGDTLLWGPLPVIGGNVANAFVVVSPGNWPSAGGLPMGTVVDAAGVPTTSPWPVGSAFRYVDSDGDALPGAGEPIFATPGIATGVPALSVRMTPGSSFAAGTTVGPTHPDLGAPTPDDAFALKLRDANANGRLDAVACSTAPEVAGGWSVGPIGHLLLANATPTAAPNECDFSTPLAQRPSVFNKSFATGRNGNVWTYNGAPAAPVAIPHPSWDTPADVDGDGQPDGLYLNPSGVGVVAPGSIDAAPGGYFPTQTFVFTHAFELPPAPCRDAGYFLNVTFGADNDANLYFNGKLVGQNGGIGASLNQGYNYHTSVSMDVSEWALPGAANTLTVEVLNQEGVTGFFVLDNAPGAGLTVRCPCECEDGLPVREFYRETGGETKALFGIAPPGGAGESIPARAIPVEEAGASGWYSASGRMGDEAALASAPERTRSAGAGAGAAGTPTGTSATATSQPGYDTWSNTFLDPIVVGCGGVVFQLTLTWSSQVASKVRFNGHEVASHPGSGAPVSVVVDVTDVMAISPADNVLSADVWPGTAFQASYALVGTSCGCPPACADGTYVKDHPLLWTVDLSTGIAGRYFPPGSVVPPGFPDESWVVLEGPVPPGVAYVSLYELPAWSDVPPAKWLTADPGPLGFGNSGNGDPEPLPSTGTANPYLYRNEFPLLLTSPAAGTEIRFLLTGELAGDDTAYLAINTVPLSGTTSGAAADPALFAADVTPHMVYQAWNSIEAKVFNTGGASGMVFRGKLTAYLCSCEEDGLHVVEGLEERYGVTNSGNTNRSSGPDGISSPPPGHPSTSGDVGNSGNTGDATAGLAVGSPPPGHPSTSGDVGNSGDTGDASSGGIAAIGSTTPDNPVPGPSAVLLAAILVLVALVARRRS